MGCGCSGGRKRSRTTRSVGARRTIVSAAQRVKPSTSSAATTAARATNAVAFVGSVISQATLQSRKRIERLRRDAIRKSLGR